MTFCVALLTECVDRNLGRKVDPLAYDSVALLTECVDRNYGTAERLGSELRRTPYGVRG